MTLVDEGLESVALFDIEGEVLDHVGPIPEPTLIKDLVLTAMMASTSFGEAVKKIELELGGRKIVVFVDLPIVRVAIVRERR